MKHCILIMDGASGWPLKEHGGKTCLELARTPNLDAMAREGRVGLARTVPQGFEPSSGCACMSILGYDPRTYYRGRGAIEARSMNVPLKEGDAAFRCNLVSVQDGVMASYSCGYIDSGEATELVRDLDDWMGSDEARFYPGVGYRHLCRIRGHEETLMAECTPPHDIPNRPIAEFLPRGTGSEFLRELMSRSRELLPDHPVNKRRASRGDLPATMIWLFWGSGKAEDMPPFETLYGMKAALSSGVDLLTGLAKMADIDVLDIEGVTDELDNDYVAQAEGSLAALDEYGLVVVHVEAPDEAGHAGSVHDKVQAIERIDGDVVARLRASRGRDLRVLVMPDHPTPTQLQTHVGEPVPFLLWGADFTANGARRLTEREAHATGVFLEEGYTIMQSLTGAGFSCH